MPTHKLIDSTNGKSNSYATTKMVVLLLLLIFATQCFAYVKWGEITKGTGLNIIVPGILLFVFAIRKTVCIDNFKPLVLILMICPFLSAFVSFAMYGQPFLDSIRGLLPNSFWLIYFILGKYHFKEKTVIISLLIYSFIMLSIMLIQQFTYPNVAFGIMSDDLMLERGTLESVEQRNGIYRFRMHQNGYTAVPVLLYYLILIKNHFTLKRICIVLSMLLIIYLSLTRQVMASAIFVLLLSVIFNKKGAFSIKYFVVICLMSIMIYTYSDVLFGEISEATKEDLNKDYIRILAYLFYWDKICDNTWTFLFGHGVAMSGSFLHQFNYWQDVLKLYSCDVGIIGIWFHYGLIYVLLYFYSLFLIFKYRKLLPTYVILFTIFAGVMSVMIFPFWILPKYYLIWAMVFYLCDLHINKSPLRVKVCESH